VALLTQVIYKRNINNVVDVTQYYYKNFELGRWRKEKE